MFYRGLLVLLVKRVSVTNMEGKDLTKILQILHEVFCSEVLSELAKCDQCLLMAGKENRGNERLGDHNTLPLESFHVSVRN